jgi:hypothetical protein
MKASQSTYIKPTRTNTQVIAARANRNNNRHQIQTPTTKAGPFGTARLRKEPLKVKNTIDREKEGR